MNNTAPTPQSNAQLAPKADGKSRKPNESGTIAVQAYMRIFDPKTQKTFVKGRA